MAAKITTGWEAIGTKVRLSATKMKDDAVAKSSELWGGVSGWFSRTRDDVGNRASEMSTNAGNRLRELRDGASARASELWSNVTGWWNSTKTDVSNRASELATNAGNRLRELRDGASARASELWSNVTGWWNRTRDDAVNTATDLRDKFYARIRDLKDWVARKWGELGEAFKVPVRFVVETVYNGGIGGLWAKAKALLPMLPDFQPVVLPPGFATGG